MCRETLARASAVIWGDCGIACTPMFDNASWYSEWECPVLQCQEVMLGALARSDILVEEKGFTACSQGSQRHKSVTGNPRLHLDTAQLLFFQALQGVNVQRLRQIAPLGTQQSLRNSAPDPDAPLSAAAAAAQPSAPARCPARRDSNRTPAAVGQHHNQQSGCQCHHTLPAQLVHT